MENTRLAETRLAGTRLAGTRLAVFKFNKTHIATFQLTSYTEPSLQNYQVTPLFEIHEITQANFLRILFSIPTPVVSQAADVLFIDSFHRCIHKCLPYFVFIFS